MFKITIKTENAAFEGDVSSEVARILETVARKIRNGETSGKLRDINGNKVGEFYFDTDDDYEEVL